MATFIVREICTWFYGNWTHDGRSIRRTDCECEKICRKTGICARFLRIHFHCLPKDLVDLNYLTATLEWSKQRRAHNWFWGDLCKRGKGVIYWAPLFTVHINAVLCFYIRFTSVPSSFMGFCGFYDKYFVPGASRLQASDKGAGNSVGVLTSFPLFRHKVAH